MFNAYLFCYQLSLPKKVTLISLRVQFWSVYLNLFTHTQCRTKAQHFTLRIQQRKCSLLLSNYALDDNNCMNLNNIKGYCWASLVRAVYLWPEAPLWSFHCCCRDQQPSQPPPRYYTVCFEPDWGSCRNTHLETPQIRSSPVKWRERRD